MRVFKAKDGRRFTAVEVMDLSSYAARNPHEFGTQKYLAAMKQLNALGLKAAYADSCNYGFTDIVVYGVHGHIKLIWDNVNVEYTFAVAGKDAATRSDD